VSKGARVKGNKWELGTAKGFASWLRIPIRRTPLSGGWGNASTKADLLTLEPDAADKYDDLVHTRMDVFRKLFVECKAVESIDPLHLLTGQGVLANILIKLVKSSSASDTCPVLVCKKNYQEPFVLFDIRGLSLITEADYTKDKPNLTFRYRTIEFAFIKLESLYLLPLRPALCPESPKSALTKERSEKSLTEVSGLFRVNLQLPPSTTKT